MGTRQRSIVMAGVACGVSLIVVVSARRGDQIAVTTAPVTQGTIARQIFATGTLQPARVVAVGAQLSGTLQSIEADFNSHVRAGDVLARLDPALFRAQLVNAQARLAQAEAARSGGRIVLDDAHAKLERAEQLAARDLISATELDAARTNLKQAAADLKAAEAGIAEARALVTEATVSLNHTIIRSPVDGIVISRQVDVGQTVASAMQTPVLFDVADLRRMQLLAEINEGDVSDVRPGSLVTFRVEAMGDQAFEGTVAAVRLEPMLEQASLTNSATPGSPSPSSAASSTTNTAATNSSPQQSPSTPQSGAAPQSGTRSAAPGVVSYAAIVEVDNSAGRLMPGGTAIVVIDGPRRPNVIRIPNNALSFSPSPAAFAALGQEPPVIDRAQLSTGQRRAGAQRPAYVWKFANGRFVPVAVETGTSDGKWTELVSGSLRPGDTLVTAAAPQGGVTAR